MHLAQRNDRPSFQLLVHLLSLFSHNSSQWLPHCQRVPGLWIYEETSSDGKSPFHRTGGVFGTLQDSQIELVRYCRY